MKIYTRKGDDGTTGLLYGGRAAKDSAVIRANGAVDEAQAALGVARAAAANSAAAHSAAAHLAAANSAAANLAAANSPAADSPAINSPAADSPAATDNDDEFDALLVALERDLYVLMAELATAAENRHKLTPGSSLVTQEMVARLEARIDDLTELFPPITEFVAPGQDPVSAALDVARTVVRRAEREALGVTPEGSLVGAYLNRLSDLVWTMARWQEHGRSLITKEVG